MDCGFWGHTFYSVKEGTFYFSPDMCCLRRKACFFFWSPHRRPKALSSGLTVEMSLQEHRLCCLSAGRGWGGCCSSVDLYQVLQVQRQPRVSVVQQPRAHRADADPCEVKPPVYFMQFSVHVSGTQVSRLSGFSP